MSELIYMAVPTESGRLSWVSGYVLVDGATVFETEAEWAAAMGADRQANLPPEPEPAPFIIPAAIFFDRLTEEEADGLDEAMMAKPVKFRRAWQAATEFREDSDLWPVLREEMVSLFGQTRTEEILTQP